MASYKKKDISGTKIEGKNKQGKIVSIRKTFLNDDNRKTIRHEARLIDTPEYQDKVEMVYEYIKQGMRSNEIFAMLLAEDEEMTETKFMSLLKYAYVFAENAMHKDREYVFQLHMDRYEKIYEQSIQMTDFWGQPLDRKKDYMIMLSKYTNAMKALHSKEDLLGLHDKSVIIEYNDHKAVVLEQEETRGREGVVGYNLDQLSLKEKVEMLHLIKEARTVPIQGIQRVTIKTLKVEINLKTGERTQYTTMQNIDDVETHEIHFEEMPNDVITPMQKEVEIKEIEQHSGIIVHDFVPKGGQSTDLNDIKGKINDNLLENFKKKIKRA